MVTSGNYASYYLALLPSENGETIDNWVLPLGTQGLTFEVDSWNSLGMRSNVSCFMRITDMPLDRSWRVAWNSPLITCMPWQLEQRGKRIIARALYIISGFI